MLELEKNMNVNLILTLSANHVGRTKQLALF